MARTKQIEGRYQPRGSKPRTARKATSRPTNSSATVLQNREEISSDIESALDTITRQIGEYVKARLSDRVTSAEAHSIGKYASVQALQGFLLNGKVMHHFAVARTSQTQRKAKKGKVKSLVPSQLRAVELFKAGTLAKNIPDLLVTEGLAKIDSKTGYIKLKGVDTPVEHWGRNLSAWVKKAMGDE